MTTSQEALVEAERFINEHDPRGISETNIRLVAMAILHGERRGLETGAAIAQHAFDNLAAAVKS